MQRRVINGIHAGLAVSANISGTQLVSMSALQDAGFSSKPAEAVDDTRVRLNGVVYNLASTSVVYTVQGSVYTPVAKSALLDKNVASISLYSDADIRSGGKVRVILLNLN